MKYAKTDECLRHGWVMDGFPIDEYGAKQLEDAEIIPNRFIWMLWLGATLVTYTRQGHFGGHS